MNKWPAKTEQFRESLSNLLPPGFAYPRNVDSNVQRVVKSIAALLAEFVETADATLLAKIPGHLCCDDLNGWEALLGLPDECLGELKTCEQRQAAIIARLAPLVFKHDDSSTASTGFLKAAATAVGFDTDIWVTRPFRATRNQVGDRLGINGIMNIRVHGIEYEAIVCELFNVGIDTVGTKLKECRQGVKITNPLITCEMFRAGRNRVGTRLKSCTAKILECLLKRIAPARYRVNFIYY